MQIYGTATPYRRLRQEAERRDAAVDKVVDAECGAGAPKYAEFHLAKRLQREAEELLTRGSMSSLRKIWGAAQIVKAAEKEKEIRGRPSAKQPAKTEETRSRADVHPQDFYGPDAARRCEIRHRRRRAFVERFKNYSSTTHNDATQHPASDTPFRRGAGLAVSWPRL